jgi:hypothetical protein
MIDLIASTGDTHATENRKPDRRHGIMRALTLVADRQPVTGI